MIYDLRVTRHLLDFICPWNPFPIQTISTVGIACQKSIPRFLLISVKYLCLSTFPKVADLIGAQSLIASHFLWQVCQTGTCAVWSHRDLPPLPFSCRDEGRKIGTPQTRPGPGSGVRRMKPPFPVSGTFPGRAGLCDPEPLEPSGRAWKATGPLSPFRLPLPFRLRSRQVCASGCCQGQLAGPLQRVIAEIKFVTSVFSTSVLSCLTSAPNLYEHIQVSIFVS